MKTLTIGELELGSGMPKICIPLTGKSQEEVLKEARQVEELPCQLVEWRADYMLAEMKDMTLRQKGGELKQVLKYLRMELDLPIIFTIRTKKEGGQAELSKKEYFFINRLIAEARIADVMDIEAFDAPGKVDERSIRKFIALAHKHHTHVLLSNHDFEGTPDLVEMMTRFFVMQELGGDLMKLAVMPKKEEDVFCLLEVAALMRDTYGEIPFIAIAMGKLGATTRICGGEFGSVITFASGAEASAPGQLDAVTLQNFLLQYYQKDKEGKRDTE